jgi:hypothetical protein
MTISTVKSYSPWKKMMGSDVGDQNYVNGARSSTCQWLLDEYDDVREETGSTSAPPPP